MGTLYENISSLCEANNVKPGKMCKDTGISRGLITDIKMGRKSNITVGTAQKIADYFGVSVDRVLGTEQQKKPAPQEGEPDYDDLVLLDAFNRADDATKAAIRLLLKVQ